MLRTCFCITSTTHQASHYQLQYRDGVALKVEGGARAVPRTCRDSQVCDLVISAIAAMLAGMLDFTSAARTT